MEYKEIQVDIDRLFSREAEAGVLGSMIIDPTCIPKVLPKLPRSESFFLPEHQKIYDALVKLYIAQKPIDAISLRTELKEQGRFDEIGGVEYIAKIMQSVPSSANAVYYTGIIREREKERQLITVIGEISDVPNETGTVNEKIQRVQSLALEIEPTSSDPDFIQIKDVVTQFATDIRDNKDIFISSGFNDLDRLINGFCAGDFVIIAGRPSMGKSALALIMSLKMAKAGRPAFFSTLEMPVRNLTERSLSTLACVDLQKLRSDEAEESDWNEIYQQSLELAQADASVILSTICYTPEQLVGLTHRLKQTHGIEIVFVDYLQLMSTGKRTESRQQEITKISQSLKALAVRENIPVVALSQLNRQVDNRENHRPRMSDLRESGSLEQDADLVLFLYRDDYYEKINDPNHSPNGIAEIIVSKNRRGPTGTVKLTFVRDYTTFSDIPMNYIGF